MSATGQVAVPLPATTEANQAGALASSSTGSPAKPSFDAALIEKVRKEAVFDGKREQIAFQDLIKCEGEQQAAIVLFIRHFGCSMCQDYVAEWVAKVNPEALEQAGVRVSIIGSGDASMIEPYAKLLSCPFKIYTQPSKALYKDFQMTHNFAQPKKGDYVKRSNASSVFNSFTNFFKMGKLAYPGDFQQNGGEQVWQKDFQCVYAHNMTGSIDHAPVMEIIEAANATSAIKKT